MKRDWDVVRAILLKCEEAAPGQRLGADQWPNIDMAVLYEHVAMLNDAGFVYAKLMPYHTGGGGDGFMILRMVWEGHDLLAQMRSDTWWGKIKKIVADKGLDLTFDTIKALAAPAALAVLALAP